MRPSVTADYMLLMYPSRCKFSSTASSSCICVKNDCHRVKTQLQLNNNNYYYYVPEASYFLAAFLCNVKSSYHSGYNKGHVFCLLGCYPLKKSLRVPVKCKKNVNLYLKCASQKLECCLTVHLPHEIM